VHPALYSIWYIRQPPDKGAQEAAAVVLSVLDAVVLMVLR